MNSLESWARRDEEERVIGRHSILLLSLVTLLVAIPMFAMTPGGEMRFSILLCLVLIAAVYVNSTERWTFVLASVIAAASIVGRFVARGTDSAVGHAAADALGLGLLAFTTLFMLNTLMHARRVSRDTIIGGICVYLLIGICFALAYILATDLRPGSLEYAGVGLARGEAQATTILYFSFVTLTTLGYGDILPVTEATRTLVSLEAVIGQLFIAIFIARLVAIRSD